MLPPFSATSDEATWLPSIIGGSNTVGRIVFGILANSDRAVYSLVRLKILIQKDIIQVISFIFL